MIKYIPLADWVAPVVPLDPPFERLDAIGWLPLADSELLLTAHYYPVCVRLDGPHPTVGVVVRSDILTRNLVGANGAWSGAYMPIALRCFPFRLAGPPGADIVADLQLAPIKPRTDKPRLLRIKDEAGNPTKELQSVHEGLKGIWESQQRWQAALDLLLVADMLVPVKKQGTTQQHSGFFTVDRHRFAQSSKHALEALSRHNFSSIDLATAMTFSQVHIKSELRPPALAAAVPSGDSASTVETGQSSGLETITPWLDTSELFPGAWAADASIWAAPATAALAD